MTVATTFPTETIFTTTEAADYLGFAEDTVRKYIQRGLIFAEKMGPIHVVRKSECDRYLREKRDIGVRKKTSRNLSNRR
jgi:excisionase family DNA binding protein